MVGDVNQFTDFSNNKNKYNALSVNLSYQTRQNWAWYSRGTLRFEKENTSQTVSVPLKACKRISFFRNRNDI